MEGGHINKTFDGNQNVAPPEYHEIYNQPQGHHQSHQNTIQVTQHPSRPEYANTQIYQNTNEAVASSHNQGFSSSYNQPTNVGGAYNNRNFDQNQNVAPPEYQENVYQQQGGGGHPQTYNNKLQPTYDMPRQEFGNQQMYQNTNHPISSSNNQVLSPSYNQPMIYNPQIVFNNSQPVVPYVQQVIQPPQPVVVVQESVQEVFTLKYGKYHLGFGIYSIVMGVIVCVIDPLLPLYYNYSYYITPTGILFFISGILSVVGSRNLSKCCLVTSLVLNIFNCLYLFSGFSVGIGYSRTTNNSNLLALGIFNAILCSINFILVVAGSVFLCSDTCCGTRQPSNVSQTVAVAYTVN